MCVKDRSKVHHCSQTKHEESKIGFKSDFSIVGQNLSRFFLHPSVVQIRALLPLVRLGFEYIERFVTCINMCATVPHLVIIGITASNYKLLPYLLSIY